MFLVTLLIKFTILLYSTLVPIFRLISSFSCYPFWSTILFQGTMPVTVEQALDGLATEIKVKHHLGLGNVFLKLVLISCLKRLWKLQKESLDASSIIPSMKQALRYVSYHASYNT